MLDETLMACAKVIYSGLFRRENAGMFHAGRGGVGGSFAMRSVEERAQRFADMQVTLVIDEVRFCPSCLLAHQDIYVV